MNDDVKAAIERFHTWEFDGLDARDHATLLAHIDGEPARTAAAREEQRASDAEQLARIWYGLPNAGRADHGPVAVVRSTPLTATPLADALVRAEEGVRYWTDLAQAEARDAAALRARVAELEREARRCDGYAILRRELDGVTFCRKEGARVVGEILAERDALRAQVEAARSGLDDIARWDEGDEVCGSFDEPGSTQMARDILRAMDEAKP